MLNPVLSANRIVAKITPVRQLVIRGTYSKGFRIPSFGEANALPTTGYVTPTGSAFTDAYLAPYGCTVATFTTCPAYVKQSYGLTTLASPEPLPRGRATVAGDVMPFIEVTLVEGRSAEQLRQLISALTTAAVESVDAPRESVRVVVREVPATHFAAGDVTIAERAASADPGVPSRGTPAPQGP